MWDSHAQSTDIAALMVLTSVICFGHFVLSFHCLWAGVLGTGLPGLGTEHLPGAPCSGTGSPALGLGSWVVKGLDLSTELGQDPRGSSLTSPRFSLTDDGR